MRFAMTILAVMTAAGGLRGEELDERRARAVAFFDAVLRADEGVTRHVRSELEAVLKARPDDALARVHLGWLLVRQAWTEPPGEARDLAEAGCAMLDAAVAEAPDDPEVRLVRARSDSQLPRVLQREAIAEADFAWLLERAQAEPPPPRLRRKILFHAAAFALRQGRTVQAVAWLEEAAAVAAASPSDEEVQSMLALAREHLSSQGHAQDPSPEQARTPAAPGP